VPHACRRPNQPCSGALSAGRLCGVPFVPPTPDAPTRLPMTAADIAELRDFISDGLGKVQVELRDVREDPRATNRRLDELEASR
jgi:hypothetical protein